MQRVDVRMVEGRALRGRILDAGGEPLPGIRVAFVSREELDETLGWDLTRLDGSFWIADLPHAAGELVATGVPFDAARFPVTVEDFDGESLELVVPLSTAPGVDR